MATVEILEKEDDSGEWWLPKNWTVEGVRQVIALAAIGYITYKTVQRCNEMPV